MMALKRNKKGGAGLLNSSKVAPGHNKPVPAPIVPLMKYNSPSPAEAVMKDMDSQNSLNTAGMSGGAKALLDLAGVTHGSAGKNTATVVSFPASSASPVDSNSNSKAGSEQAWKQATDAQYDANTEPPKPLGTPGAGAQAGGRKRRTRKSRGARKKRKQRRTRRR